MKTSTIFAFATMAFASFAVASPQVQFERDVQATTTGSCSPDDENNKDELNGSIPTKRDVDEIKIRQAPDIEDEDEVQAFIAARAKDPCCNSAQIKRTLSKFGGSCKPEGKRLFKKSSHNCANEGGQSYLCVHKVGDDYVSQCITGKKNIAKLGSEKGECFINN